MVLKSIILLMILIFATGCQPIDDLQIFISNESKVASEKQSAKIKCMELCQDEISNEKDLSSGPCLSEEIIQGWVCDIAHNPRQEVDNKSDNQCQNFISGKASHFVELDGNCNLIKAQ